MFLPNSNILLSEKLVIRILDTTLTLYYSYKKEECHFIEM